MWLLFQIESLVKKIFLVKLTFKIKYGCLVSKRLEAKWISSRPVVFNWEYFCSPEDIWQYEDVKCSPLGVQLMCSKMQAEHRRKCTGWAAETHNYPAQCLPELQNLALVKLHTRASTWLSVYVGNLKARGSYLKSIKFNPGNQFPTF